MAPRKQGVKCDIDLPDDVTEVHGYHFICCKNFMAISKLHLEKNGYSNKSDENTETPASFATVSGKLNSRIITVCILRIVSQLKILFFKLPAPSTSSTSNIGQESFPVEKPQTSGGKERIDEASGGRSVEHPTSSLSSMATDEQESRSEQDCVNRARYFCIKACKVSNYRVIPFYNSTNDQKLKNDILLLNAVGMNDQDMENRVQSLGKTDIIRYQNPCKTLYLKKYLVPKVSHTDWHKTRAVAIIAISDGYIQ